MRRSPPVRMNRSGSGTSPSTSSSAAATSLFGDVLGAQRALCASLRKLLSCLHHVPAPAVAHGHLQLAGRRCRPSVASAAAMRACSRTRQRLAVADEAHAHAVLVQLRDLAVERIEEQAHQARALLPAGRCQFSLENANSVSASMLALRALLDGHAHGVEALLWPATRGMAAGRGPAPVAVHDDCDVPRETHVAAGIDGSARSNLHDLLFLRRQQLLDVGDVLVGELLDVRLPRGARRPAR